MGQVVGDGDRAVAREVSDAARKRAAVETYARHEAALRRVAQRYSICLDDADEALQRALEILLRKAPCDDPRELIRWTQTVVRHEALAVRRERERILGGPAAGRNPGGEDWVSLIPSDSAGPAERAERHETIARGREALSTLKPQELRALTLLAEGYSYREIGAITGFSQTKVNRCLAEGRERFRRLVARSEDGRRCAELRPLLSAFCDDEAGAEEAATLREHLRACPKCRSTLRTYRAAPAAAGALAPTLALHRGLVDRLHDLVAGVGARLGGGGDSTLTQVAAGGGTRGAGAAALAKALAVCAGTVGGAAACVATGVVPVPLEVGADRGERPPLQREAERPEPAVPPVAVEYEPAPEVEAPQPEPAEPEPAPQPEAPPEPVASDGAVEYTPPPAATSPPPAASTASGSGSAAGEFGP
jgi:RNA polymerase sigma factor (sigma-70 family)